jgi:hypothetical protein
MTELEDRLEGLFVRDANARRVIHVAAVQPTSAWKGVFAFTAAAVVAGVLALATIATLRSEPQAAGPSATTPPASSAGTTPARYDSPLGYSVQLPTRWRRSDLQSRTSPNPQGDPDLLGGEAFTTRSPADEEAAMRRSDTGVGPALVYTAGVGLYRNTRNLSATAYAERQQGWMGLYVASIEPTTVDGRTGAKTTFKFTPSDTSSFYVLYVPDGDRMWVIGYFLTWPGGEVPAGATEEGVRSIVESFRFAQ